ncbi:hypothetical protein BpHYR1_011599 [Brachionus plicatilis]|uniref:Uncharacterized protein n=1 Tax=Brachionus plicatilis TaxID=10195 RepID=A0A3M7S336_BRAPC|nr:hypothetical protein BpHYR1_011599 [Brachionus plicatilis]
MSHRLQLMLPHDKHYVQFKENHDYNHTAFDKWPNTQLRVYDIEEELIRYANEFPAEKQISPREENETSFNPNIKPSHNTKTGKASFLKKIYRSYLEKTSNNVIRLYDKIKVKNDRNGIGYKEEELAKNEARRAVGRIVRIGPKI